MRPYKLLLVEDEKVQLEAMKTSLEDEGYIVESSTTAGEAINIFQNETIDIVITDYNLPDKDGQKLLVEIKIINPEIPVIFITAYGTIDRAVNVMKSGAYDYLSKPVNMDKLLMLLKRACEHYTLISENVRLREELKERFTVKGIIAASPKMQEVLNMVGRVASSKASVLVRGESGTGKEIISRTIHYASPRKNNPFIAFNAAALSPALIESELFGHEKGAFTGADRKREGRFVNADKGTLFIDEIGDIPVEIQTKFLRVLQESVVEPIGSDKSIPIDVRIIAATNKDIESMIKEGIFREDFYYRLNVVTIHIPPLRGRKEDILPLCDLFIKKYAVENEKNVQGFTREAFNAILKYHYPGNVRELENMVERAVVLTRNTNITVDDLPPNMINQTEEFLKTDEGGLDEQVEALEKHLITKVLRKSGGNQSQTARYLNISERKLRYKLKKYNLI